MKKTLLLLVFIMASIPYSAFAGGSDSALKNKAAQWMNNEGIRFLENKGQMMDMQNTAMPDVLYEASGKGMDVYVTNTGLSYVFINLKKFRKKASPARFKEHNDSVTETYCRADMQLVGASIKKENIVQEGESENRTDYYYGGICPDGILDVHSYGKVTVKNIYPGIDWVLHSGKNGLKYDFIVHPGAAPSQIKLKYKWADAPQLQPDGSIKINTPMGSIIEGTPVSYSGIPALHEKVQTTYRLQDSIIQFNVSNYSSAQALTIDPILTWATYYPRTADNDLYMMTDDGTNVWLTGLTYSTKFPTLNPGNGAYFQGTKGSVNSNAYILKFNIAGVLKWATYYGGNGIDIGSSIYSDGKNVWETGWTSSSNFPTQNPGGGAYFQGTLKGQNAFIVQFDTAGIRKWATYYGGSTFEEAFCICSDKTNVWVTGYTGSTDFPTLNPGGGAYFQGALGLGGQNGFVLQFNTAGVLKWATYYGGSQYDYAYSIQSDSTSVWITGYTTSSDFPVFNPGGGAYYQATNGGGNAFILQFNTSGVRKWATYYGGNAGGGTYGYSIQSDRTNVWVTGPTYSSNLPVHNPGGGAYFQGALKSVSGDGFILQFNTAGVQKWATYYGGSGAGGDGGTCIQSDGANVWLSGWTGSTDFPLLNPGCGFYQDTLGRNSTSYPSQDVFISQFSTTGVPKWATYYGTDIEDDRSCIWSDKQNLFIAGDADYSAYPLVNPGGGAYQFDTTINTLGDELVFVGKFNIGSGGDLAVVSSNVSICRGGSDTLHASGAISYTWSPSKGLSATNIPNPVASPTVTTTYTVTGIDTGTCGGTFVDSVRVTVDTLGKLNSFKDTTICSGSSIILSANGGGTYTWSNGATTSSISIANDKTTQTYTVSISNGVCLIDTSIAVKVVPSPKGHISGATVICGGGSTQLTVSGGTRYLWSNGSTDTTYYTGAINGDSTIHVIVYNSYGCAYDTSITVTGKPAPGLSACCDGIIVAGNDTTLSAYGNTAKSYVWAPQVSCLNPPLCDSVQVSPTVTTTYTVISTDSVGCQVERTVTIAVEIPCVDFIVPNVFTPTNAGALGLNNVFYIKTNPVGAWDLSIFDLWGVEMYHSANPLQYWDGTAKGGGKAPDGVYYYIISATCQGTSYKKDGFVQVIR